MAITYDTLDLTIQGPVPALSLAPLWKETLSGVATIGDLFKLALKYSFELTRGQYPVKDIIMDSSHRLHHFVTELSHFVNILCKSK